MRVLPVLLALAADLAWNLAGAFWGFTILAVLVLWIALHQANVATGSKAYATEQRLNAAMARIPNPQNTTGPASSPNTGASGNNAYQVGSGTQGGGPSDGNSGHPLGGAPTDHYHSINHSHSYGQMATDFNTLVLSHGTLCSAFNKHVGDYQNLNVQHNAVVAALQNANIFH